MESPFDLRSYIQSQFDWAFATLSRRGADPQCLRMGADIVRVLLGPPDLGADMAPFSVCAARSASREACRLQRKLGNAAGDWVSEEASRLALELKQLADVSLFAMDRRRACCAAHVMLGELGVSVTLLESILRALQREEDTRRQLSGFGAGVPVFYFGGSFDPPTRAHADIVKDLCGMGSVIVGVLADRQKAGQFSLPVDIRVQLVREMVSELVVPRNGVKVLVQRCPVVDMLARTCRQESGGLPVFPDFLAVGTDCKDDLIAGRWKCGRTVLDCCDLHVVKRPEGSVSSTQVRKILAEDQDGLDRCVREGLLTKAVAGCLERFSSK